MVMNTAIRHLALAGLFLAVAGSASAAVTVTFSHPEKFSDLPFSPIEREQVLKDLGEHFASLSKKLPAGQDLKVEVLDVDLAGRIYPNIRGRDLRIMRGGADWPHMRLRYTLEANGQVLRSGVDDLSDMAYQDRINRYSGGDPLRYEKQMIDDWFTEKILQQAKR
jgi:hypothetical protein